MNHRVIELLANKTGLGAETTTIDLDMLDPISEIQIRVAVTNGVGANTTEHPVLCLSKIEIIDGSDVLFSLDGPEAQALDIYRTGIHPRGGWFNYLTLLNSFTVVGIGFGRWLWDEVLALDPSKFSNPQLRITLDKTKGGMSTSANELKVEALVFDEKVITPIGFLMTKEFKRWVPSADGYEYTDLPRDHPYRKLLIQNRTTAIDPRLPLSNIKLASDHDKKVICNNSFEELLNGIGRENAYVRESLPVSGALAQRIFHITPTMQNTASGTVWGGVAATMSIAIDPIGGGQTKVRCETANNVFIDVAGWAPHGCLQIPFGNQGMIEDWFDVARVGSLSLETYETSASGLNKVCIEQLRPY